MKGETVIEALKRKFRVKSDRALTKHLGNSIPAIQNWKKCRSVTPRQIAGLVHKASFQSNAIRPVVEFFRITKCGSPQAKMQQVFSPFDKNKMPHPYRAGLRDELEKYHGVYVFFDSRGQAIYTGKARRQNLWKEINLVFNRKRGDVQSIRRVTHPERRQPFKTTEEKHRKIVNRGVPLHELAVYFSAYRVPDTMVNDLESLLVRSFANDLLNIRMENFSD
jgi:hypothetical protein